MPAELRRIEFSEIELRDALSLYQTRTQGGGAKKGQVSALKVTGGNEFNIVAKVNSPVNHEVVRKVFDHSTTIAVIVVYAKSVGIPLPREGVKMLAPTKFGGVAMNIRYEPKIDLGPMRTIMKKTPSSTAQASAFS